MRIELPFEALFRGYQRRWLTADLLAGLTVWAILVPEALAYGTIAGVPPILRAVRSAVPGAGPLCGGSGSRHLVVGPIRLDGGAFGRGGRRSGGRRQRRIPSNSLSR